MGGEKISPLAGKPAPSSILVDVGKLLASPDFLDAGLA